MILITVGEKLIFHCVASKRPAPQGFGPNAALTCEPAFHPAGEPMQIRVEG